ncbi:hypothetical protein BY996DRAFT_6547556 [Phakopsora pachyrhizi]|nr:hypothetical protein BY996DRAFT_6547556 [Phakopsora pachyrhizi]
MEITNLESNSEGDLQVDHQAYWVGAPLDARVERVHQTDLIHCVDPVEVRKVGEDHCGSMTQSFFYQNFESYGIRLLKNKLIHTTFQKLLKAKEAERCGDGDLERFWVSSWKSRKMISVELIKRVEHPESGFVHDKDQCISPYQDLSPKQAIFFCGDGSADCLFFQSQRR